MVPIMSQMNPIHTFPPYFSKFHSNIILQTMPMSSEWSLPFRFSDQNFLRISHLTHACYMLRPSRPLWLDHLNNAMWSVEVMFSYRSWQVNYGLQQNYRGRRMWLHVTYVTHAHNKDTCMLRETLWTSTFMVGTLLIYSKFVLFVPIYFKHNTELPAFHRHNENVMFTYPVCSQSPES